MDDAQYFDCYARSLSDVSGEMARIGVQTQLPPLPRHHQPDAGTWDEHGHALSEERCNLCMHTSIEFLLEHLSGSQADTSQATRKERTERGATSEFAPSPCPSGLSRTSTVVDINAMAATLDLEFDAPGAHNDNLPARNMAPRREPRPVHPISKNQFMPLGMMAAMMAKTISEKASKSTPAKRKRG